MAEPKPSSNLQVAVSSLVAIIVGNGVGVSYVLARIRGGPPLIAATFLGTVMFLGVLFLPLLWWRHRAGYAGSIGVGVWAMINTLLGLADVMAGRQVPDALALMIVNIVVSVVLIISSAAASREKA